MSLKPICKLAGEDGNVFNLIAIVRKTLKCHHLYQQLDDFDNDLKLIQESAGSYDAVLVLFTDYVEVVWGLKAVIESYFQTRQTEIPAINAEIALS